MKQVIALAAIALTACAPVPCKAPAVVTQTVTRYVAVPPALTALVPTAKPVTGTVAECVDIAVQRAAAIGQCNAQLQSISKLQEQNK